MPKKFIKSFKYAQAGAAHALQTQRNIWIHLTIGGLTLGAGYWLKLSNSELALIVLTVTFVLVAEMFNTALEETINLIKPETHPTAALVKNVAAGAVLLAAAGAVVVGLLIFLPRLSQL
jgi:diacylglycerol kinase